LEAEVNGRFSEGALELLECTWDRLFHLCGDELRGAHLREVQIEVGESPWLELQSKLLHFAD
jgi:hypothetical protein